MSTTRRDPRRLQRNARDGVRTGLWMAGAYSAVATAIMVFGGFATELTLAEFLTIIGAYYAAGLVGGATAGAFRELGRTWTGTALLGMGVGVSVFLALGTAAFGSPLAWGQAEWFSYAFSVVVLGPITAVYYRYKVGD